jgi:hypothetical protein
MALWGLGLGVGLGAAYGMLVGAPFPIYGIFGPPLGAMFGAIAGLPLGLLEGLVLGSLSVWQHRRAAPAGDFVCYRRTAQLACVVACILAVVSFWGIEFWRVGGWASVRVAFTRDLLEAFVLVVGPLVIATGATWFAARRVAGTYAHELAGGSPLEES